jgi:hypothetical protein
VAFVKVIPVDETVPKVPAFVTERLPPWIEPLAVIFVAETLVTESCVGIEKTSCPEEVETTIWFTVPVAITTPVKLFKEVTPPPEVEVTYLFPETSKTLATVRFVPVAFTKVMPVEETEEILMLVPVAFVKRSPGMVEVL